MTEYNRCQFYDKKGRQCVYKAEVQNYLCIAHFFNVEEISFAPAVFKSKPKKINKRKRKTKKLPKGQRTLESYWKK
jgi:hypothetical protein